VGVKNNGIFSYFLFPPPLNPLPPGEGKVLVGQGTRPVKFRLEADPAKQGFNRVEGIFIHRIK